MQNLKLKTSFNTQNPELEKNVLACFLLGEHGYVDSVTEDDFASPKNADLYKVIRKITGQGKIPDLMTVSGDFKEPLYVAEVASLVPSAANVEQWIGQLKEYTNIRRLKSAAIQVLNMVEEGIESDEILSFLEFETRGIESFGAEVETLMDVVNDLVDEAEYRKLYESEFRTGFVDLDRAWHHHRGDLVIVAGRPSMGKTALMLALAKNLAGEGEGVGIFSIEMSKKQLAARLVSSETSGKISFESFTSGVEKIADLPIYITDNSGVNLARIRSVMRKLSRAGVSWVFIDYLQIMEPPRAENRNLELGVISRTLKKYAKEFNMVVVALSQLSRAVEQRSDKRPVLADLRESGSIEQDADTVLMLYRPIYYGIRAFEEDGFPVSTAFLMEVLVRKQRNYRTGEVKMHYDPEKNFFSDRLIDEPDNVPF
jgi:replicative DNA helicase